MKTIYWISILILVVAALLGVIYYIHKTAQYSKPRVEKTLYHCC